MDKEIFFTDTENKAVCLLCQETIAVLKEFNLKRHHETKHKKLAAIFVRKNEN